VAEKATKPSLSLLQKHSPGGRSINSGPLLAYSYQQEDMVSLRDTLLLPIIKFFGFVAAFYWRGTRAVRLIMQVID